MSAKPATLTAAELDAQPAGAIVWVGPSIFRTTYRKNARGSWSDPLRLGQTPITGATLVGYGPSL